MIPNDNISTMLAQRISVGDFPSAVYLVAEHGEVVFADALGLSVKGTDQHEATLDTIYDLASLTKPLVTGMLCAQLVERGEINLGDPLAKYFPAFESVEKKTITLRHLLTHSSGLPAWQPLYLLTTDPSDVPRVIAEEPLEYSPGSHVRYSDLGFVLLGLLLEKLSSATLAQISRTEIFEALELKRTFFVPDASLAAEIAASEFGNVYERGTREAEVYKWRESLIWGEVHDGNAHFLGGAAGHAGLFSTATETFRLAMQFLPESSVLLKSETCELFRRNMTSGLEEARSFSWQLAATPDSTAGPALAADSFGHLGFTGTSCWIDPTRARTFILLTNRTHTDSLPFVNINGTRREFNTRAAEALNARDEG